MTAVIGSMAIVSCGPSAEEKAAAEQARLDSITQAEKAYNDSLAAAEAAAAAAEAEAAAQDSAATATEEGAEEGHEGHAH